MLLMMIMRMVIGMVQMIGMRMMVAVRRVEDVEDDDAHVDDSDQIMMIQIIMVCGNDRGVIMIQIIMMMNTMNEKLLTNMMQLVVNPCNFSETSPKLPQIRINHLPKYPLTTPQTPLNHFARHPFATTPSSKDTFATPQVLLHYFPNTS